ncbi:MAG: M23 family metallopeptidase [Spirochaetales bacterium]|nr:M23 family metallopeptidase [Spirochaetales bacterium]
MTRITIQRYFFLSLLLILFLPGRLWSSPENLLYPRIEALNYSDLNYRQLQEDIEFYYRAAGAGKELPPLLFYSYTTGNDENIFSLASQAGLPYETIASLNRISSSSVVLGGLTILIPSQAGIFIPAEPKTDLEFIALSWRLGRQSTAEKLTLPILTSDAGLTRQSYFYFPGERFHDVERAYFLGILFSNPLPEGIVSSGYGMRQNPFSGHNSFHNGIDIAAPIQTSVYAAREGEITDTGYNEIFGNYIEIAHQGGYSTFYGHLNKIFVELHSQVNSTMIIAEVGSSGRSTGPHLHFEIRKEGLSRNPARLTPGLDE